MKIGELMTQYYKYLIKGKLETPHGLAKLRYLEKFDNGFFGVLRQMAARLDVLTRLSLERAVEAIVDAGKLN